MGTIAQKLTYLEETKTAIGNAIAAKGGSVTGKTFRQYATEISNLPSGGGNQDLIDLIERDITSLNIPSGTTKIGNYAFYSYGTLTSVTIPNSVTSIGDYAFFKCSSLTSVTIPNSVTSIGNEAFQFCAGLTSVTIGNSVTSIGGYAFNVCIGLTSVTIPNSVRTINDGAFSNCTGLTSITIPNSVTDIGGEAFYGCGLTSITFLSTTPPSIVETSLADSEMEDCIEWDEETGECIDYTVVYSYPIIYVPAASVNTYRTAWASYSNLVSRIQAIPTE